MTPDAKAEGLLCGFVSNGNATPEVLDFLRPVTDVYKVDLKGFREAGYRSLGGTLRAVLDTIAGLRERGFWVEVVTLVVPGFNDSDDELRGIARFLAGVSADIPWHVTAFHRDYKRNGPRDTEAADLARAAAIGRSEGLRYVYAGNRPGAVGDLESTFCPGCGGVLPEPVPPATAMVRGDVLMVIDYTSLPARILNIIRWQRSAATPSTKR